MRQPAVHDLVARMFVVFAALSSGTIAEGQRTFTLEVPAAAHEESFSLLSDLIPLRDGRVVALDQLESRVILLDANLGSRKDLVRSGSGPGEVRAPTHLLASPSGVLVFDRGSSRFVRIDENTLRASDWFLPQRETCAAKALSASLSARAVDARGRLYGPANTNRPSLIGRLDIEMHANACQSDTVASITVPVEAGAQNSTALAFNLQPRLPFPSSVQWVLGADGAVVFAESDGYRVRSIRANNEARVVSLPFTPIRVSAGHKAAWKQQKMAPRLAIVRDRASNTTRGEVRVGEWEEPRGWPATLPPFLDNALVAAPDTTVWIRRTTEANDPPTYDVLDAGLRVIARVVLKPSRRIVAVGRRTIYVVRRDSDDLEWLERYAYPAGFP